MNHEHEALRTAPAEVEVAARPRVTALQRHFLIRLAQLVTLHERVDTWPTQDELPRLLVGGAIYSTLRDCEEAGAGLIASQIIACGKNAS